MRTLQGWIGGLGGAVAITAGVVTAALMVTAVVAFHGGASKVKVPGGVGKVTLAQNGQDSGASGGAATKRTGTAKASSSSSHTGARTRGSRAGSVGRSLGGHQRRQRLGGGNPHAPVPQSPKHTADSPSSQAPVSASPTTGPSPTPGGGGGNTTTPAPRSSTPVGDTVRNTTDALGNTVGGATQTVGNTVGTVSPALGNTVNQVAPVLDNTVKNTGDAVGGALDGLLGGHH
jgi:hypothetical protein